MGVVISGMGEEKCGVIGSGVHFTIFVCLDRMFFIIYQLSGFDPLHTFLLR